MLNIPSLPTDNIYKFKVTGGFALIFLAFFILYTQSIKSLNNLNVQSQNIEVFETKIKNYSTTLDELKRDMNSFKTKIIVKSLTDSLKQKSYRDFADFMLTKEIISLNNDQALVYLIYEKKINKLQVEIDELQLKSKIQSVKIKFDYWIIVISSVLFLILIFYAERLIRKGFKDWKNKLQIPLDQKL